MNERKLPSPDEARTALLAIEASIRRMKLTMGRSYTGYHLVVWGLVWLVFGVMADLRPDWMMVASLVLFPSGVVASIILTSFQPKGDFGKGDKRVSLSLLAVFGFIAAMGVPLFWGRPPTPELFMHLNLYIALACMGIYTIVGLWYDHLLTWLGLVVAVILLGGFILYPEIYWLCFGLGGGLALLSSGLWIRVVWVRVGE